MSLGFTGVCLRAQPPSPLPEVYEALRRGLTVNAQRLLERGREHPDSLVRQEAALLAGYLAARGGRESDALREWYGLSQRAPHAPLGLEAAYWRADLLLRQAPRREAALYILRSLIENPHTPPDLRTAVENRLLAFFWRDCDVGTLWTLAWTGSATLYPYLLPPLLYQLRQSCAWPLWRLWQSHHEQTCGALPDSLRWETLAQGIESETLRVVLLLPLMAAQERSSPFLEFWQGFELGLEESTSPYAVWAVRVEDSERSSFRIQELLTEWAHHPPHLIVGEVSWSLNQPIADFCERMSIWHAVPINPAYPGRTASFSLVPPARCIGARMAAQVRTTLPAGRGIILYDPEDPQSKALLEGFRQEKWVPAYPFPTSLSEATRRWATLKDSISDKDWYGVFLPQEEVAGFLLHKLGRDTLPPLVLGMESWQFFSRTDLRSYPRLRIWLPQSLVPDSARWHSLSQQIRQRYSVRPTFFHAQGYDAARWLSILSRHYAPGEEPKGSYAGILNFYQLPVRCESYRLRIWEYDRGTVSLRYGP